MSYDSYKLLHSVKASPKAAMLEDKKNQIDYLYNIAVDKEDNCMLNGNEFHSSPRIFDLKISKSSPNSLNMETVRKEDEFYVGDILFYDNSQWLCISRTIFHGLYCKGIFEECNWLLKWQNSTGDIIERWAVIKSASKYNDGEDGNGTIVLGSDQLSVAISVDKESLYIKRNTKFFIDNNDLDPTVYELTGTNNVTSTRNGHGITSWIVKECAYSPTPDDLKYGVCDYIAPTTPSTPTDGENQDKTTVFSTSLKYTGDAELKIGGNYKTITGIISDSDGNETSEIGTFDIITIDELTSFVKYTITDNILKIKILDNESAIGGMVRIKYSTSDGESSTYTDFNIISSY